MKSILQEKNEKNETVSIKDPEYLMLSSRGTELPYYLYSTKEFNEYFDENGKGMTKSLMKNSNKWGKVKFKLWNEKTPHTWI